VGVAAVAEDALDEVQVGDQAAGGDETDLHGALGGEAGDLGHDDGAQQQGHEAAGRVLLGGGPRQGQQVLRGIDGMGQQAGEDIARDGDLVIGNRQAALGAGGGAARGGAWGGDGWWRALAAVLLFDPSAVLGVGTWLSFGLVAALVWVSAGRLNARGRMAAVRGQWAASLLSVVLLGYLFASLPPARPPRARCPSTTKGIASASLARRVWRRRKTGKVLSVSPPPAAALLRANYDRGQEQVLRWAS